MCGRGEGGRLTPRRAAVLVYIQDDRGWVHIPSRSAVFADIQDVCVCVCVGEEGEGRGLGLCPGYNHINTVTVQALQNFYQTTNQGLKIIGEIM